MNDIEDFKSYNGNPLLKRSGVAVQWTPELVQEYMKCSSDPIYFCENYVKIVNIERGLIKFEPYDYQKEIIKTLNEERYTIIATARQSGKCFSTNTPIKVRNKNTGCVLETTVGEFYESRKKENKQNY